MKLRKKLKQLEKPERNIEKRFRNMKELALIILLCFINCGLVPSKPGPISKRSVIYDTCIRAYIYTTPSKADDKNSNLYSNNTLILCLLYANTFSNDPTDCTSNDFRRFLEKNNILETGGCPSNTNRE
jgi:hypothetical protein